MLKQNKGLPRIMENKTKIGEHSIIWGIIIVALSIFTGLAIFLFFIPIILGILALKRKDKLGYFGILLGIISWIISLFIMPYIRGILFSLY